MKEILQSYKTAELRSFIREHNKKIRKEISEEIKQIRKNIKAKRLINVAGKKRDEIIEIMLKNKNAFKNIKIREEKSQTEKDRILDEVMQPILEKGIVAYKKDGDKPKLRKVFVALRGIAKRNDIPVNDSLAKQVEKQIKEIEDSKPQITKLESQESIDKLIEVFDLETAPKKKNIKFKVIPKGTKAKAPDIKVSDFDEEQLKLKVDKYLKKINKKNGDLFIALKDAKIKDNRNVAKKDRYFNQYDRFKDLLKNIKTEKELNKLKKEAKKIVDKRFAREED